MAIQPKVDTIDKIITDPAFIDMCVKVMEMEPDIDEDYLVPISEDEEDEEGNPIVRERKGDYGDMVKYIPVKYIRERADLAFKRKYSFLIVAERREVDPFERRRYNRDEDDYESVDGDKYMRCVGMMIVPGLGVKMAYGVKKVRGGAESSDWKACQTDAFKKCCEAFGIYLDYQTNDDDDDEDSGSSRGSGRSGKSSGGKGVNSVSELDLDDIEYDEDELEEAGEVEVDFGKYNGYTLSELLEEDEGYFCWLVLNARDDDVRKSASIVAKAAQDEDNSKAHRKAKTKAGSKGRGSSKSTKSSSSRRKPSRDDDEEEEAPRGKSTKMSAADKKKRDKLMAVCEEALEDCDKLTRASYIKSVSVSDKYKRGKSKLEDLTIRELEELAEVLADEDSEE